MKKFVSKLLLVVLVGTMCLGCLASLTACNTFVDYVEKTKLDMTSSSHKAQATVKTFIDGDTTHFTINDPTFDGRLLKARYIGIDTPESTGQIEEYGKKAAAFTKERLSSAESIILECDGSTWDADSTGTRYLVWVWYRTSAESDYRLLNLEILQNGLAIAKSTGDTLYGDVCYQAIDQAEKQKVNIYSGEPDPDFYKGEAIEMTMKQLRTHIEDYAGAKVSVEGVVVKTYNNGVYLEEYDPEDDLYYGIYVFYAYGADVFLLGALKNGNRIRAVGKVSEFNGTYQISDVKFNPYDQGNKENIAVLSSNNEASYRTVSAERFVGKEKVVVDEELQEFDYGNLTLDTTVTMDNLVVQSIYTTTDPDSSSVGAMTITCKSNGKEVVIRTEVLYDDDGYMVTESSYLGKTLKVRGIVDSYEGKYQIHVFDAYDITVK